MTVTVLVPKGAEGYGNVPAEYKGDDKTVNWGNAFDNKYGDINSKITLIVKHNEQ
jgi:hypothetical protein